MTIKFLTKSQEQDIHCGLTKKIQFNRERLNRWMRKNPDHPDKAKVIHAKVERIKELERLRESFTVPNAYRR